MHPPTPATDLLHSGQTRTGSEWLHLVSPLLLSCCCWLHSPWLKLCVALAQRHAAHVSTRSHCAQTECRATSWPASSAPAPPSFLRQPMGKKCVPNLQTHGWRRSLDTWTPELARMSTCEDGGRSVFPNGASRGSPGQPVNISWVYMTISIIHHTTVSDLLGEVDCVFL